MITINAKQAVLLVKALKDSHERCCEIIERAEVGDVSSYEEYLLHLWFLSCDVRAQYLALEKENPHMLPYARLWPESAHELEVDQRRRPPKLERIK